MPKQFQIGAVIVLVKECRLAPVPTLGHVVRDARNHTSRQTGHAASLRQSRPRVNPAPEFGMVSPKFPEIPEIRTASSLVLSAQAEPPAANARPLGR